MTLEINHRENAEYSFSNETPNNINSQFLKYQDYYFLPLYYESEESNRNNFVSFHHISSTESSFNYINSQADLSRKHRSQSLENRTSTNKVSEKKKI